MKRGPSCLTALIAVVLVAIAFAGCAGPQLSVQSVSKEEIDYEKDIQTQMALDYWLGRVSRIHKISYPILAKSHSFCGSHTVQRMGVLVAYEKDVERGMLQTEIRAAAKKKWGLSTTPVVISLSEGSPADKAGIRFMDKILSIDGNDNLNSSRSMVFTYQNKFKKALSSGFKDDGVVEVELEREGEVFTVAVQGEKTCDYPVALIQDYVPNAYATGQLILVTTGMVDFVGQKDNELAAIISHELAHNSELHIEKKTDNSIIGAGVGALLTLATGVDFITAGQTAGALYGSQDFEKEADYLGLIIMMRAGFDCTGVSDLFRRIAVRNPGAITWATTHPTTADRYTYVKRTCTEIKNGWDRRTAYIMDRHPKSIRY